MSSSTQSTSHRCAVGDLPTIQTCNACKAIKYCCKGCQKSDWSLHKVVCAEYITFIENNPRPADSSEKFYKLALFFPISTKQPVFMWLDFKKHAITQIFDPDLESLGKDCVSDIRIATANYTAQKGRKNFIFHHQAAVFTSYAFLSDGSKENQSVSAIWKRFYHMDWKGACFCVGAVIGSSDPLSEYVDIEPADPRHAVCFFKTSGR